MAISKQTTDFQPNRPSAPIEPAPAIARIRTPTSTGAMIDRIRRRNRVLRNSMRPAQSGAARPRATPPAIPMRIHQASEIRGRRGTAAKPGRGTQRSAATTSASAASDSSDRFSPSPPTFRSRITAASVSGSIQAAARYPATLPPWP